MLNIYSFVDPCFIGGLEDLLIGDKNAILVAARILGYGQDYEFKYVNPETGEEERVSVDLTEAEDKWIDESLLSEDNRYEFDLGINKNLYTFGKMLILDVNYSFYDKMMDWLPFKLFCRC